MVCFGKKPLISVVMSRVMVFAFVYLKA